MKYRNSFRKTIVVISSSLVYLIICGTIRLNSQLFLAVRERFGADREQGSLPFTLLCSVRNLSGPLIGFLGNKFGLRCTTVVGCLLSSVSIAACFLVEDVISFTILWGIGLGIGFGLSTTLIPNILHLYFKKSFNLVQGIFLSGGSSGSLVLPGVAEYLLGTYGTSGTFLIMSGFVLNSVPLAMLLKFPEETPKIESYVDVKGTGELLETTTDIKTISGADNGSKYVRRSTSEDVYSKKHYHCQDIKSGVLIDVSRLPNSNIDKNYNRHKDYQVGSTDYIVSKHKKAENVQYAPSELKKYLAEHETEKNVVFRDSNPDDSMENLDFYDGKSHKYHVTNLPQESSNFISRNLQVFFDPAYILILISLSVGMIPFTVLTTVMVDACRDKGVFEDVTILMTFATADIVGRLFFGYIADLKCTSPLNIYALTNGFCGFLLIGFSWLNGFYSIVVFFFVVGILMGGIAVTPTGVVRDNIEKKNLTMAFSSRCFLFGLLNFSQPSVIGYFRETLQSYDGLFYFFGSMFIFGAAVALCVPMTARYRERRRNKKKDCVKLFALNN